MGPNIQEEVQKLLIENVTASCRSILTYQTNIAIKGLLAITVDKKHTLVVEFNESVRKSDQDQTHDKTLITSKDNTNVEPLFAIGHAECNQNVAESVSIENQEGVKLWLDGLEGRECITIIKAETDTFEQVSKF